MSGRQNRHFKYPLLAAALLLVWCGAASAATFHVSPNGLNVPPYDAKFKAANYVGDAVLAASGYGDTILIHPGSYDIDTTIYLPAGLTLAGIGRDEVVLNWVDTEQRPGRMFEGEGDHEIFGIEFNYPLGSSYSGAILALYILGHNSTLDKQLLVRDSRFRELTAYMWGYLHNG